MPRHSGCLLCFSPKTFLTSLLNSIETHQITILSNKPLYSYCVSQNWYLSSGKWLHRLQRKLNFSMVPEIFLENHRKILQSENAFWGNRKLIHMTQMHGKSSNTALEMRFFKIIYAAQTDHKYFAELGEKNTTKIWVPEQGDQRDLEKHRKIMNTFLKNQR